MYYMHLTAFFNFYQNKKINFPSNAIYNKEILWTQNFAIRFPILKTKRQGQTWKSQEFPGFFLYFFGKFEIKDCHHGLQIKLINS